MFCTSSKIPGAGRGLFAAEDIDKGTILGEYTGPIHSEKMIQQDEYDKVIYFRLSKGKKSASSEVHMVANSSLDTSICGGQDDSMVFAINHTTEGSSNTSESLNASFKYVERESSRVVIAFAKCPIKKGQEIYASYGFDLLFINYSSYTCTILLILQ